MPRTDLPQPELRLHLPPDMLAAALRPLRDGGSWVAPEAWAALVQDTLPTATSGPRYWCFAHADRLLREGLAAPDLRVLLAGLRLVLEAARNRLNDAEAMAVVKATSLVLAWLPFEADVLLDEEAADDARVYQLARALLPFVEAAAWERQEAPVDLHQRPVLAGGEVRWACMAGLAAKLHAEAVLAKYARDLVQDPYDDPIPGTDPGIWNTATGHDPGPVDDADPACRCVALRPVTADDVAAAINAAPPLHPVTGAGLRLLSDDDLAALAAGGEPLADPAAVPTATCKGCGGPLYGDLGTCGTCYPLS